MTVLATRRPTIGATVGGIAVPTVLSARCSFGFDMRVAEATIYVPENPWPTQQAYNQAVSLSLGYSGHPARFQGLFRGYDYTLYPRMVGMVCKGQLVRADEYENNEDNGFGGIELDGLLGAGVNSCTDEQAVSAALSKASVGFDGGNIGGTGVVFGTQVIGLVTPFQWRSGRTWNPAFTTESKGETALSYIERWDAVSAVYTSDTAAAGVYRTFESLGGTVYRALIGGRPRGTVDFTFTEGEDIETGTSQRQYPLANRVYVQGYDLGGGLGPVSNLLSTSIQASNPFMPNTQRHTYTFGSPMIEKGLFTEPGVGMDCETVANAIMLDVNREIVQADFTTPRDDWIGPGATILVQGTLGGEVGRLGIGEHLWVSHVDVEIDATGKFSQRLQCTGGGLPDDFTPAPA